MSKETLSKGDRKHIREELRERREAGRPTDDLSNRRKASNRAEKAKRAERDRQIAEKMRNMGYGQSEDQKKSRDNARLRLLELKQISKQLENGDQDADSFSKKIKQIEPSFAQLRVVCDLYEKILLEWAFSDNPKKEEKLKDEHIQQLDANMSNDVRILFYEGVERGSLVTRDKQIKNKIIDEKGQITFPGY
jgi:hypothetical protein